MSSVCVFVSSAEDGFVQPVNNTFLVYRCNSRSRSEVYSYNIYSDIDIQLYYDLLSHYKSTDNIYYYIHRPIMKYIDIVYIRMSDKTKHESAVGYAS